MKQLIHLILLLLISCSIDAQTTDMIYNKGFEFNNYYKEINSEQSYIHKKIDVTYHSFRDDREPVYKKINKEIFDICVSYIENETQFSTLNREVNLRLEVYNELKNSENRYNYGNPREITNPRLVSIECKAKSIVANQAFYEVNCSFEANTHGYDEDNKIIIRRYYKADLKTGKISPWKPIINIHNKKAIQKLVAKEFNEAYLLQTKKLNQEELLQIKYDDENDAPENHVQQIVNVFDRIDLKDADFYWDNNGLIIQFQEYSKGSILFGGSFFRLFFPYEEALKITALLPEFTFINTLPHIKHNFSKWNETEIQQMLTRLQTEPSVIEIAKQNNTAYKVRTLQQITNQISDDGSQRFMNKILYEFDVNRNLLSKLTYNDNDQLSETIYYDYDKRGNLSLITVKNGENTISTNRYEYDKKDNINKVVSTEHDGRILTEYYFYNQDFVYRFSHDIFDFRDNNYLIEYKIKENMFCNSGTCYKTDQKGQVINITSDKETMYQKQIGRDLQGRIAETHFEDDRYNYYFEYDDRDRFKKFQNYESQTMKQSSEFEYDGNTIYPKRILNQSDSTIEKLFEWSFF